MSGYLPLSFVQEKVRDLETALFFSTGDALLKMPTCIVKILHTDEFGQLWFAVPRPTQFIYTFEKIFPAKLDFFRKGFDYYLKILGKAFIVNDPEDLNRIEALSEYVKEKARLNELVIVKVRITHADYTEKNPVKVSGRALLFHAKNLIRQWFPSGPKYPGGFSRIPANHQIYSPVYSN